MADVTYIISLKDRMTSVLRRVSGAVSRVNRQVQGLSDSFDTLGTVVAGAAIVGIFKMGAELEKTHVLFNTLTGSVEKGNKLFGELEEFANMTPFQNAGLEKNAQTLLAFGFAAEDIIPTLKTLGDVAIGDQNRLNSLALVFGQARAAGKLMGQDLLQFINVGFNPLQIIAEKTGRSMSDLKDDMRKGKISFEMVTEAFQLATEQGGRFHNLTEKISKTMAGKWSTALGKGKALVAKFGLSMKGVFTPIIDGAIKAINFLAKYKDTLFPVMQTLVIFAGVVLSLVAALKVWTKVQAILNVLLTANPIGLIVVGIAALIAIIILAYQKSETFRIIIQKTWVVLKKLGVIIKDVLIKTFEKLKVATADLRKIIRDLFNDLGEGEGLVLALDVAFGLLEAALFHVFNVIDFVTTNLGGLLEVAGKLGKFIRMVLTGDIQLIGIAFTELGDTIFNLWTKRFKLLFNGLKLYSQSLDDLLSGNFKNAAIKLAKGLGQIAAAPFNIDIISNIDDATKIAKDAAEKFKRIAKPANILDVITDPDPVAKKLRDSGIVSGGRINTFNVNIHKVTGIDTLKTENITESGEQAGKMVMRAILKELADVKVQ